MKKDKEIIKLCETELLEIAPGWSINDFVMGDFNPLEKWDHAFIIVNRLVKNNHTFNLYVSPWDLSYKAIFKIAYTGISALVCHKIGPRAITLAALKIKEVNYDN